MDEKVIKSPDTARETRVPPGQRLTESWPVLHHGPVPSIDISKYKFTITGMVKKEREFTFEELSSLPLVKVFSDIHCVTHWTKLDNLWEGIGTSTLRESVDILPGADFIIVKSTGGFTTNLTSEDFFQEDVLLAIKHNGSLLGREHGYPVRLVVPRLYFWKSAKWVTGIEFVGEDKPGFWESAGYHNRGDPWMEERYW
ncbi:MAG: sulfite oxidase-like oxidoreductase [Dehalococcoidia bacterium]|nr:sulfite oxidase-like oxidoreductase [Dehalococcoidia bacterium]